MITWDLVLGEKAIFDYLGIPKPKKFSAQYEIAKEITNMFDQHRVVLSSQICEQYEDLFLENHIDDLENHTVEYDALTRILDELATYESEHIVLIPSDSSSETMEKSLEMLLIIN